MRRYGTPPQNGRRYTRRPGVYAILPREGQVLLTHQQEPVPEFQLPGGGIDPGEHPIDALHREVWEETGWSIAAPLRLGVYKRFTYMPEYDLWAEKVCTIYLARPVLRRGPPVEPGHSAHWMPAVRALDQLGTSGDRAMLAGWLNAAPA